MYVYQYRRCIHSEYTHVMKYLSALPRNTLPPPPPIRLSHFHRAPTSSVSVTTISKRGMPIAPPHAFLWRCQGDDFSARALLSWHLSFGVQSCRQTQPRVCRQLFREQCSSQSEASVACPRGPGLLALAQGLLAGSLPPEGSASGELQKRGWKGGRGGGGGGGRTLHVQISALCSQT